MVFTKQDKFSFTVNIPSGINEVVLIKNWSINGNSGHSEVIHEHKPIVSVTEEEKVNKEDEKKNRDTKNRNDSFQ